MDCAVHIKTSERLWLTLFSFCYLVSNNRIFRLAHLDVTNTLLVGEMGPCGWCLYQIRGGKFLEKENSRKKSTIHLKYFTIAIHPTIIITEIESVVCFLDIFANNWNIKHNGRQIYLGKIHKYDYKSHERKICHCLLWTIWFIGYTISFKIISKTL